MNKKLYSAAPQAVVLQNIPEEMLCESAGASLEDFQNDNEYVW